MALPSRAGVDPDVGDPQHGQVRPPPRNRLGHEVLVVHREDRQADLRRYEGDDGLDPTLPRTSHPLFDPVVARLFPEALEPGRA